MYTSNTNKHRNTSAKVQEYKSFSKPERFPGRQCHFVVLETSTNTNTPKSCQVQSLMRSGPAVQSGEKPGFIFISDI